MKLFYPKLLISILNFVRFFFEIPFLSHPIEKLESFPLLRERGARVGNKVGWRTEGSRKEMERCNRGGVGGGRGKKIAEHSAKTRRTRREKGRERERERQQERGIYTSGVEAGKP